MVHISSLVVASVAATGLIGCALAHPGEHHDHEEHKHALQTRDYHSAKLARGLASCANSLKIRNLHERAEIRRFHKAEALRAKRGLPSKPYKTSFKRDLAALEAFEVVNHNETSLGYATSTSASTLFGSNTSCILTPEVTYGPYYVTGEYIRQDVTDGQEGVPLHLEFQFIDVSTCEPVEGMYLDLWNANATGVYSGVVASGNGNNADAANINTTFLRGIQATDSEGVAAFDTIIPGHYDGRATHTHVLATQNVTINANSTFSSGVISHVGQLFWPTDLKAKVEATYPYNTNTQTVTTNDEDTWAPDQAENSYDPFAEYAYLGDDISDGLLAWISIGIDTSADYEVEPAGELTSSGGVASDDSVGGSGGGNMTGGGSNSTMSGGPGGSMSAGGGVPSGSAGGNISGGAPSASTTLSGSSLTSAGVVALSTTASSIVTTSAAIAHGVSSSSNSSASSTGIRSSISIGATSSSATPSIKTSSSTAAHAFSASKSSTLSTSLKTPSTSSIASPLASSASKASSQPDTAKRPSSLTVPAPISATNSKFTTLPKPASSPSAHSDSDSHGFSASSSVPADLHKSGNGTGSAGANGRSFATRPSGLPSSAPSASAFAGGEGQGQGPRAGPGARS